MYQKDSFGDVFDVNAGRDNRARGLWKGVLLALVLFFLLYLCSGNIVMWISFSLIWLVAGLIIQIFMLKVSHVSENRFDQFGGTLSQIYHGIFGLFAPIIAILMILIRIFIRK